MGTVHLVSGPDLPVITLDQFKVGVAFLMDAAKQSTFPSALETIVSGSVVIGYVAQQVDDYFDLNKPNVFGTSSDSAVHDMSRSLAELAREIDADSFDADLRRNMQGIRDAVGGPIVDWVIAAALDRLLVWLEEAGLDFLGDAIAEILDLLDG